MDVRDKVVIITGASAGIGLVTARLFAREGARVALAARSFDTLKELEKTLPEALAVPVDMRDPASIRRMVEAVAEHYGRIDVLINNAGVALYGVVEDIDLGDLRHLFEVNVVGVVAAMQAVLPTMRAQGGGVIVNVSSSLTKKYRYGVSAYAASKSALNVLSLAARDELAPDNICVGVIYPLRTATDLRLHALGAGIPSRAGSVGPDKGVPGMPEVDTPENVAEKILEAVRTERAEQYMSELHERMHGGDAFLE